MLKMPFTIIRSFIGGVFSPIAKLFKKVKNFCSKIYNSRGFEIVSFIFESINACVDFHEAWVTFKDQMKLVIASLAIVGKFIKNSIRDFSSKHRAKRGIAIVM